MCRANDNEYRRRAEVQISADKIDCKFTAVSQLDTACPICLIKARFIPTSLIVQSEDEHYEGINDSVLEVRGTVKAKIRVEHAITGDAILRVVPEHTMKCDILLDRDALKKLGLTIIKQTEGLENTASAILNIKVNEVVSDVIDKLDVCPNLPYAIKNRVIEKFWAKYLRAERPAEPKVKAELKLNVKDKQPFYYAPSRLSVGEKIKYALF
ncbi:unnamed protein product [Lasius platythorax]|uniref:Vitellogenin n=1 Tax=Lasius platythorax TaxID=488582 RepID=A0AAV2MWM0_9HYME